MQFGGYLGNEDSVKMLMEKERSRPALAGKKAEDVSEFAESKVGRELVMFWEMLWVDQLGPNDF